MLETGRKAGESTMSGRLLGRVAVVTGGNSGIGLATAERFVAEGAYVFITGRRQPELDAAVKQIGRNVTGVQGDVSRLTDLDRLYETVKQEKGQIDVLFANAGAYEFAPLAEVTEEHFDRIYGANVKGLVFTVQKALPLLSKGASVILNASWVANRALPAFSIYSSTKAAVRSFARTWSVDLKDRGIRVNALSPGIIPTPGFHNIGLTTDDRVQEFIDGQASAIPLGRAGTADEIAKAAVFLASDESSYVTATDLVVDGGVGQV
jgi:NAD(P)-dependent dehydrogenase (short-subunit alcohol dehydrogenase family)